MNSILITGAAGFIGSNLVDRLLEDGYKVVGIDNFDPFYDRSIKERNLDNAIKVPNFKLIECDIRNRDLIYDCLRNTMPDMVVHLAAKVGIRPSIADPEEYIDVNLNGSLTLLEAMRKLGLKKMIFASSSSVYGNNLKKPFCEDDPVDNPISPYAASKKAGELMCHTYHHLYNMDIFCLRFFTVYGPRQRPDLVIHKFSDRIMNDQQIPVFGDGTSARDYTFINDIVSGIRAAMNRVKGFEVINLGGSQTTTLAELIGMIENAIGKKAVLERHERQAGDVDITLADISKAKSMLDYSPSVTEKDGIRAFVQWKIAQDK